MAIANELNIDTGVSADQMFETIFGEGVQLVAGSATYSGSTVSAGIYSGATTTIAGISPTDGGVILSTGNVGAFTNSSGTTNTNTAAGTGSNVSGGIDGDAQLNAVAGVTTFDGAILTADFIPDGDWLTMQFVFSSEEYPEYVNEGVNDAFGVWVNGSFVPVTISVAGNVSIDSVNAGSNENLYRSNIADQFNTEMDGITYVLSIKAPVNAGEVNSIKIGIADGGDAIYDSNLLIMADSAQTVVLAMDDQVNVVANGSRTFDILANDAAENGELTITQINGQNVVAGQTVTLPSGQQVRLNADNTITVFATGTLGEENFTYTVNDGTTTDIGYVTINTVTAPTRDGIVSGTSGNDVIDAGYPGDPDGDRIDNADGLGVMGTTGDADLIYAGAGDDSVTAGAGNDIIFGGDGSDTLSGGVGSDTLTGGDGADTLWISDDHEADLIEGGEGGIDSDTLAFSNVLTTGGVNVTYTGDEAGSYAYTQTPAGFTQAAGSFSQIEALNLTDNADAVNGAASAAALSIDAGAGNDAVTLGSGGGLADMGEGDDMATGGAGSDTLIGGDGNDMLSGGTGDDSLTGDAGDDRFVIADGAGADTITGGETAETTGDVLDAGAVTQDITLDLAAGTGGAEDGTLTFTGGTVTFAEIESVILGSGDDSVIGSAGADRVTAGAGGDRLAMGAGADRADLGSDGAADTLVLDDGDGTDTVIGFEAPIDNGDGTFTPGDLLDVAGLTDAGGYPVNTADVTVTDDGNGNAVLTFPNGEALTLVGVSPAAVSSPAALEAMGIPAADYIVEGTAAGDLITATYTDDPEGDLIDAGDSATGTDDDLVQAFGGADIVLAGLGNDTVYGGDGADTLLGEAGDDSLLGEADDDVIDGGDGADLIDGGTGNDTLTAGTGDDSILGGTGSDTIYGDAGADRIDGGTEDDKVLAGEDADTITGGTGNDTLAGEAGDDSIAGEDGSDTLDGGAGNDILDAGNGNDFIEAGSGNDTVLGGAGDDSVNGAEGDDRVYGGAGNDYVRGSFGNDTVTGGTGDDYVWGGYGDDIHVVEDNFGNDTVYGDSEQETLGDRLDLSAVTTDLRIDLTDGNVERGSFTDGTSTATFDEIEAIVLGAGDDTLELADYGGSDRVEGFAAPTPNGDGTYTGRDLLDVSDLTSDYGTTPVTTADVTVADDGAGNAVLTFPGGESLTLVGVSPAAIASPWALNAMGIPLGLDQTVEGTAGDDLIDTGYMGDPDGDRVDAGDNLAGTDADLIDAGAGNDTVVAGAGDDSILGGSGNDAIAGGDGADRIDGGTGDDTLSGGAGDDVFVLSQDFRVDTLTGGETGETGGDTLNASGLVGDVTLDLSAGDPASPEDGTLTMGADVATFAEIETIALGAGDDSVIGSAGADTVDGGAGNDTLAGNAGADSLSGGAGNDSLVIGNADTAAGGDDDDLFTLTATGDTGPVSVIGGSGTDTLELGDLADLSTLTITGSTPNGLSGTVTLDDGSILSFAEIENIICFTPGARIATPHGARPIETLAVDDLVVTRDHGLQPIRWIGRRTVAALGRHAPVRIRPGVVTGLDGDLIVSPQHRMLFRGHRAELLFGEAEVLVAARHLIDGRAVTREEGGSVTYIHILFDQHEIVFANGAATESFHPGEIGLGAVTAAARDEIFGLFPELRSLPSRAGRTARRCLKRHEALLLQG